MTGLLKFIFRWRFDLIIGLIYSGTFFYLITVFKKLDIKDHNLLLSEYLNSGHFPIPPGYYFFIYLVDLLIRIRYPFVAAAAIVLTFFSWWKYKLVLGWFTDTLKISPSQGFIVVLGMLFLSPIYIPWIDGEFWYLGKFTSTTWHNSTLIAVFPFSLLLTFHTLSWLDRAAAKSAGFILFFGLLILLIKPSFLFCFIPAFPIYSLIKDRKITPKVLQATGISALLFVLILVEKHLIFSWDPMIRHLYTPEEQSKVVVAPMKVWLYFSDQPVFDFFSSFPLLIGFCVLWKKEAFKSSFFSFSLILLLFALLIYGLFAETGFREFHGNFYWQIPIALFLSNLSIVSSVLGQFLVEKKKWQTKYLVMFSVFFFQVALGIAYWLRIFTGFTLS